MSRGGTTILDSGDTVILPAEQKANIIEVLGVFGDIYWDSNAIREHKTKNHQLIT